MVENHEIYNFFITRTQVMSINVMKNMHATMLHNNKSFFNVRAFCFNHFYPAVMKLTKSISKEGLQEWT